MFSALGASVLPSMAKGWRSYASLDTPANMNLVTAARTAGVRRFVYVSVANHRRLGHLHYVLAHERVVEALRDSGLEYTVVRPTGFFSAFATLIPMARRGPVPLIGDGSARTNPIHDDELAAVCVRAIGGEVPRGRGALQADQGLQPCPDQGGLLLDLGQAPRLFQQVIINVQCRSHMYHMH